MSAVVMTTSTGSPANAWQATSASSSVVLEQRRAGDEHERPVDVVEPWRGVGGWLPEPGPDEVHLGRPVRARVLERLGRVGEHGVGGEVGRVDGRERRHAELGAQAVDLAGDDALQGPERQRARETVAQSADLVVAWP